MEQEVDEEVVEQETPEAIQWQAHAVVTYPYPAYRTDSPKGTRQREKVGKPPSTVSDDVTVTAASEGQGRAQAMQILRQRHPDGRIRMTSFHRVGE